MRIDRSLAGQVGARHAPTLQSLLNDPMTQWIMESDGVRQEALTDLLALVRERLRSSRAHHSDLEIRS